VSLNINQLWVALINAGVGAFIAVIILVGIYKLAGRFTEQFIEAQNKQAEALGAQAQSMAGLSTAIRETLQRDTAEHREILIMLKVLVGEFKAVKEKLNGSD